MAGFSETLTIDAPWSAIAVGLSSGSVPRTNHSLLDGSTDNLNSTLLATTPAGGRGWCLAGSREDSSLFRAMQELRRKCRDIPHGAPEKLPIQILRVTDENPMHQLSLMSLLVPVLTAVQNRVDSGFS